MRYTLRLTAMFSCLLVSAGCSGGDDDTTSAQSAAASCSSQLTVDGTVWVAIPLGQPLDRRTGASEVDATRKDCVDVKVQGEPSNEGDVSTVTLETIAGVSPGHGLFLPEEGWEDQVWVPESVTHAPEDLPADVRDLQAR